MHLLSSLNLTLLTTISLVLQASATPASHAHAHSHSHSHNENHQTQTHNRRALSLLPALLNLNVLDLTKLSNVNLTGPNNSGALGTLNEVLEQLPLSIEFWALNRTAGVVGLSLDMGLAELAEVGLVSFGRQGARGRNARVNVNVTITRLVD